MDTEQQQADLRAFCSFIDEKLSGRVDEHSLDEAVAEFRKYQSQLAALRKKLQDSADSALQSGASPLTDEEMGETFAELDAELAKEGISE